MKAEANPALWLLSKAHNLKLLLLIIIRLINIYWVLAIDLPLDTYFHLIFLVHLSGLIFGITSWINIMHIYLNLYGKVIFLKITFLCFLCWGFAYNFIWKGRSALWHYFSFNMPPTLALYCMFLLLFTTLLYVLYESCFFYEQAVKYTPWGQTPGLKLFLPFFTLYLPLLTYKAYTPGP